MKTDGKMMVEVDRFGHFYFDGVYVRRDDTQQILNFFDVGKAMSFCPACWRVTNRMIVEAKQHIAKVCEVSVDTLLRSRDDHTRTR